MAQNITTVSCNACGQTWDLTDEQRRHEKIDQYVGRCPATSDGQHELTVVGNFREEDWS